MSVVKARCSVKIVNQRQFDDSPSLSLVARVIFCDYQSGTFDLKNSVMFLITLMR